MSAVAVAASRSHFRLEGDVGRWWYKVIVRGARGGLYEVELMHVEGRKAIPFKVQRSGRTTRRIGNSARDIRREVEQAAALVVEAAS